MSFLSRAFGLAIKKRRKELKLTQEKLAELIDAEIPTISRWETGDFLPGSDTADRLIHVLSIEPADFLAKMGNADNSYAQEALIKAIHMLQKELEVLKVKNKSGQG